MFVGNYKMSQNDTKTVEILSSIDNRLKEMSEIQSKTHDVMKDICVVLEQLNSKKMFKPPSFFDLFGGSKKMDEDDDDDDDNEDDDDDEDEDEDQDDKNDN